MVVLVGQQFLSIYVVRLAWLLNILWFSEIETSGLGKMGDLSYMYISFKYNNGLSRVASEPDYWYGYSRFAYMEQSVACP